MPETFRYPKPEASLLEPVVGAPVYRCYTHRSGLLLLEEATNHFLFATGVFSPARFALHSVYCLGESPIFCLTLPSDVVAAEAVLKACGRRRRTRPATSARLLASLHFRKPARPVPLPATSPSAKFHPEWLSLLQRTLQQKPAEAAKVNNDLVSHLSHELRSPLTAILGNVEVLSNRVRDSESLEALDMIQANGQYLLDVLNQVLDMSKLQAQKLLPDLAPVSLNRLVGDVLACVRVKARLKNIDLSAGCFPPVPVEFTGDACRIRQILINLLDNALKFTRPGGTVNLLVRYQTFENKMVFEVKDNGIGIHPEHLSKLFKPFSQAHGGISARYGGSGLGLSISLELARLMGGNLDVESTPGVGTCFRLSLPAGDLCGTPRLQFSRWKQARPPFALPLPLLASRILLLDYSGESSEDIQNVLETAGAEVKLLRNTAQALSLLQRDRMDLIVVHTEMPGFESYSGLRQLGTFPPLLVVAPGGSAEEAERALAAGCDGYIVRGQTEELLRKAARLLRQGQTRYPFSVLVIDDHPMAATALAAMLRSIGCRVEVARCASEARAKVQAVSFELLLIDIEMAGTDGYELLDEFAPLLPEALFIAHTGHPPERVHASAAGRKFNQVLQKPVEVSQLRRLLGGLAQKVQA